MEPKIQYAQTSDGVNIAFADVGEGPPVIAVPPIPWSDVQAEWADPGYESFFGALTRGLRWIRYDSRGSGSSDRDAPGLDSSDPFDAFCLDIDAVADKLGLEEFGLTGIAIGGPIAIRYAATRPERVTRLALWNSPSRLADLSRPQSDAIAMLMEQDFDLYTETIAHAMIAGWGSSDDARRYAAFMREATGRDSPILDIMRYSGFDLTSDLVTIACPTLVIQRREAVSPEIDAARYIATRVPDSQLVILEGGALLPWVGDMDSVIRPIEEFLGSEVAGTASAPLPSTPEPLAGMVTILFTDIEGSTTLTQRVGDAQAQETLRAHNAIVRQALKAGGGTEIKHTGDGIMASFPLASSAVEAAINVQRSVEALADMSPESAFRVRVGLNAGEPVAEESPDGQADLFGSAVQLARRVCDAAPAGSIYVTDVVRQLTAGKGLLFSDVGDVLPKGFEDPVRLYEVRWREDG